ncbi:DUF3054 domain-containing protein [Halosolutus gelatinilyticus]|uniref:DUF3054 domain-containing protein n=1 Tax=Halosolutus gelatinilyticus TaxID=2931975 RepID=UPI001FF6ED9B|nr:DUF3054 domain-containing protein [Halosolutus gelatinilyticus]
MDAISRAATRGATADRETLALGAIDVAVVVGFVTVGLLSHDVNPIADPITSLETIAPFALGWLVIAPVAGVYARDVATSAPRTARSVSVAWIAAANVGLILRSSPAFDGGAVWPFNLVMTGFGLLALLGWRLGYATLVRSTS